MPFHWIFYFQFSAIDLIYFVFLFQFQFLHFFQSISLYIYLLFSSCFLPSFQADFSWSIKAENESVESLGSGDSKTFKDKSFYVLKEDYEIARTYRCVANNSVGVGAFCEIEVAGK